MTMFRGIVLGAFLGASCSPEAPPSAPPMQSRDPGPRLKITGVEEDLGQGVDLIRFTLDGRQVKTLTAVLWTLEKGQAHQASKREFVMRDGSVEGELWVLTRSGKSFGKPDQLAVSMGGRLQNLESDISMSSEILLTGPFKSRRQQFLKDGSLVQGVETILLERTLDRSEGGGESGASSMDVLKERSRTLDGTIVALTLLWAKP